MLYHYDHDSASLPVEFISHLKLSKDPFAGKSFEIQDWQKHILHHLFGWKRQDNTRKYRTAYLSFARKNGKSTLCAGIGLYMLFCGERGGEIYIAASDRDQASIIFNEAAMMVRQDKDLLKIVKIIDSKKTIINTLTNSVFKALSSDAGGKHGYNPSCVIMDELHVWKDDELYAALTSGSGARLQPLTISITTAGYDENSICGREYQYAVQVRDGVIEDPSYFVSIYEVAKEDDWRDERTWIKANPALGVFNSLEYLREQYKKAENVAYQQNTFKRLYLNQWTGSETTWMNMDVWKASAGDVIPEALIGKPCYAGLDLSATNDITALILVFPIGESFQVLSYFFMPEGSIMRHRISDKVPYDSWVDQGYIITTPGEIVDYSFVLKQIQELRTIYDIRELAFDRFNATQLSISLQGEGLTVIPFGQGYASMSGPTKELMNLTLAGRLHHGNNPVLNFMADCAAIEQDAAENIKIVKANRQRSAKRVDGMVCLVMALDRALRHGKANEMKRSVYEDHGLLTL